MFDRREPRGRRDGKQVGSERHLVEGKQRARRDAEILLTGFAAPAGRAARAAAGHTIGQPQCGQYGSPLIVRPAKPDKNPLYLLIAHPHHGRQRERPCAAALEHAQEMAVHESPRTTKLYDRTKERLTQDEVERIRL
jgi:hypothetical protein